MSSLADLAERLLKDGPHKHEQANRRVRVIHNHAVIVDTTKALLVWEHPYYPQLYIPFKDLKNCSTEDKKEVKKDGKAGAAVVEITVPGPNGDKAVKTDRVVRFEDGDSAGPLAGFARLEFGSMGKFYFLVMLRFSLRFTMANDMIDQWLEEDTPIYVHPKDPYKRVDILASSRSIEVKVGGKTVAKSPVSSHLHETGLPTRYYLPLGAVDQSVLRKSDLVTKCPYKGEAEYYHVVIDGKEHKNIVWYYRLPTHESAAVAGQVCFYNEKVDIVLDGEALDRPKTIFG
jgi:uncharacterized protein (DUF427 family)